MVRRVRRHARVLGDAVFGVLVLSDGESELTEEVVGQPAIDEVLGQKGAPSALGRHAGPDPRALLCTFPG
jgi:hypothetical protein